MMARNFKIIYLPENSSRIKEFNFSRVKLFLLSLVISSILVLMTIYSVNFLTNGLYNFKLKKLEKDKMVLKSQLQYVQNMVGNLKEEVGVLIKRDDEMRIFADLPQYDEDVREVGVGGSVVRGPSLSSFYSDEEGISSLMLEGLSKLERQMEFERESYQEIYEKIKLNMEMVNYWPSIRPVKGGRISERFGRRVHPISGEGEMHRAIDFSVPLGTPIMATADGTVEVAGRNMGYGNYVRIDHSSKIFGYKTAYGHLNKILVKRGQKVKKGDIIGEVGRTGMATASHLHYEVWYNGEAVNPISYYYDPSILY